MFETDEPIGFIDVYQVKKKKKWFDFNHSNFDYCSPWADLGVDRRGHNRPFSFENEYYFYRILSQKIKKYLE